MPAWRLILLRLRGRQTCFGVNSLVQRRKFIEICVAGTGACIPLVCRDAATAERVEQRYARAKLVDQDGKAIRSRSLKVNHGYVFSYPYTSTPCFLLKLDTPVESSVALRTESGSGYQWPGGVGENKTVVAYSAICAHKLAYPTRQVSFIGFRPAPSGISARGKVIACCADKSVYDPGAGARVLSGPAPQPLAAIILEHDAGTDELFAVGTFGGEKFNDFFRKYEFQLAMEHGGRARDRVAESTSVVDLASFSRQTAQC